MSNKRLKSNIKRINLDTKSKKQADNVLIQQYEKVGRKLPSKLLTGTATKSDMKRYKQTLINTLDRRIAKDELKTNSIQSNLHILNDLQTKVKEIQSSGIIEKVLEEGASKASYYARKQLSKVYRKVGLR